MIAGLSFVISGLVQVMIQDSLTPVPDYGRENSLMVTNAMNTDITVSSIYWEGVKFPAHPENQGQECTEGKGCTFNLVGGNRTRTFDWLQDLDEKVSLFNLC